MIKDKPKDLEFLLNQMDYSRFKDPQYPISMAALQMINFIKLVNNGVTENKSPLAHLEIIDAIFSGKPRDMVSILCSRGLAKTSLGRFILLYIAVHGELPGLGKVDFAVYVSDTIENGVRSMSSNLKAIIDNSQYLQQVLDTKKTTINLDEWTFVRKDGSVFYVKGIGVTGSIRGANRNNSRPKFLLIDDILTDANAKSPTILETIKECIYDKLLPALHPKNYKIVWTGTPFNRADPLTATVANPDWTTILLPLCERFPCTKDEFIGAWEDRFDFKFVFDTYEVYKNSGRINSFNKEFMLKIVSDDDKLVPDSQILWYEDRSYILQNKHLFNFYITTDFAVSEKQEADYSVISVWCVRDNKWYWVDGILKRQDFGKTIDDLFRLCAAYEPVSTAIEVSGQQAGFIPLIQRRMTEENIWFSLATDKNTKEVGIRPNKSKLERFNLVLHLFQNHRIMFPEDLADDKIMIEAMEELRYAALSGFKSAHDDFIDTISQLQFLREFEMDSPEEVVESATRDSSRFEDSSGWLEDVYGEPDNYLEGYI